MESLGAEGLPFSPWVAEHQGGGTSLGTLPCAELSTRARIEDEDEWSHSHEATMASLQLPWRPNKETSSVSNASRLSKLELILGPGVCYF